MRCPYYDKVHLENHPARVNAYCEADVTGRLRVPSLFEETHYCTTDCHSACPVFQDKQANGKREENPGTPKR